MPTEDNAQIGEEISPDLGEADPANPTNPTNPTSPTEVTDEVEDEVKEVAEEVVKPPGVQDTHQTPQKRAVTAITDMVQTLGTVWLLSPVLGSTNVHHAPEGPTSLVKK